MNVSPSISSGPAKSSNSSMTIEQARAEMPILASPALNVNRDALRDFNSPSVLLRQPDELMMIILKFLVGSHDCLRSPYDRHKCRLPNGPVLHTLNRISQSSKLLYSICLQFRASTSADPFFRKSASRLEFDFKKGLLQIASWNQLKIEQHAQLRLEFEESLRDVCRKRYGLDPLQSPSNDIPQNAYTNIVLTGSELSEMDMALQLQKYWTKERAHTLFTPGLSQLDSEHFDKLANFLGVQPESLTALDLGYVPADRDPNSLVLALSRCIKLQHVAVSECPVDVISIVWTLPALVSLKLKSLSFEPDHWDALAEDDKGPFVRLECLQIEEANEAHWNGLLKCLGKFSNMRDLRLQFGFKVLKLNELQTLKAAFDKMPRLEAVELPNVDKSAFASLTSNLPRELRALTLSDQLVDDASAAALIGELKLSNSLASLKLHLALKDNSAKALNSWLAQADCSLRHLHLEIDIKGDDVGEAVTTLVEGLCANHSVESLQLKFDEPKGSSDSREEMGGVDSYADESGPRHQRAGHILALALPRMTGLRTLHVRGHFSVHRTLELALAAMDCPQLLELHLKGGNWTVQAAETALIKLQAGKSKLIRFSYPILLVRAGDSDTNEDVRADMRQRFNSQLMRNRSRLPMEVHDVTVTSNSTGGTVTTTTAAATPAGTTGTGTATSTISATASASSNTSTRQKPN